MIPAYVLEEYCPAASAGCEAYLVRRSTDNDQTTPQAIVNRIYTPQFYEFATYISLSLKIAPFPGKCICILPS